MDDIIKEYIETYNLLFERYNGWSDEKATFLEYQPNVELTKYRNPIEVLCIEYNFSVEVYEKLIFYDID